MNFFEHQDKARQKTQQLLGLFAIAISIMIVAIYIVVLLLLYILTFSIETIIIWWQPTLFFWVSATTISLIALASLYKILSLRQGGCVIAQELGGRLLLTETASEQEQQLLNIVEEMAIASGIPIPKVYLLDREPSLNAFAAGFSLNDAVIGVTRGCIEKLNRDQLQGVVAHEFSHILNGDMVLNLRLMGLLYGILFIYLLGREMLLGIPDEDDIGFRLWPLALALMAIGGIGLLCGRLIKAAVSRQREFLADASAVQFTRNPDSISGALQKLQEMDSRLLTPKAEAASHMFFGNAVKIHFWEERFATHPPLAVRIRRVNGVKVKNISNSSRNIVNSSSNNSLVMGFAGGNSQAVTPEKVVARIGTVTPKHFDFTQELLAELPESLRLGVKETQTAPAILFALTLENQNSSIQEKQLTWLRQVQTEEIINLSVKFNQEIAQLNSNIRLPLLDLTIPALRQLPLKECQRVCKCTQGLIAAKKQASVQDFVVRLILWHRLQSVFKPDCDITVKFNSIAEIWSDCLLVLSAIAQVGENNPDSAAYAFSSGIFRLRGATQQEKPKVPLKCNFSDVQKSIANLRQATPKLKQAVVDACAHTVLVDNKVSVQERDLLRAIAMTLDCPIPPFLNSKRSN
ncbi:MAG: M48 family metallopeptidase [Rivularia sp. (in: Bacteria)]|nr:M48 family metallopeptidase [Rivularia sp. MS3]